MNQRWAWEVDPEAGTQVVDPETWAQVVKPETGAQVNKAKAGAQVVNPEGIGGARITFWPGAPSHFKGSRLSILDDAPATG